MLSKCRWLKRHALVIKQARMVQRLLAEGRSHEDIATRLLTLGVNRSETAMAIGLAISMSTTDDVPTHLLTLGSSHNQNMRAIGLSISPSVNMTEIRELVGRCKPSCAIFLYTCARCGHEFRAPVAPEGFGLVARGLGLDTLIQVGTTGAEFEGFADRVMAQLPPTLVVSDHQREQAIQSAYAVVLDPDVDGNPFVIGRHPRCPMCRSPEMDHWIDTGESVGVEIADPTKADFDALYRAQQAALGEG